jgi:UDP-N-acetylmuramyl pentapeptide phosphotransferase/UDP-N-acetylglucosamine-1-phosphate transferase
MSDELHSAGAITLAGFLIASMAAWILSRMSDKSSVGIDRASGVQKFHVRPTSRLGGVAIVFGIFAGVCVSNDALSWSLMLCAIPVFAGGLVEDVTHRVGPNARLLLAIVSASAGYIWLGIGVHHTDVWPVDQLLKWPFAGYLVTMLVVAGFTNGVNIIDGFHGLAAGTVGIMMASFLAIAIQAGDAVMIQLCGLSIACVAGFLLFNWPWGKIFLGDAGAYLLGFWVVEVGLLLVSRNPTISPMAPVVVGIFPLIETLFTMYRRKFVRNHPVNHPDALHLHTLVYRRLVSSPLRHNTHALKNQANARVAWYFWLPATGFGALAVTFQSRTAILLVLMLAYLALYLWLYRRLVQFRAPRWMISSSTHSSWRGKQTDAKS